MVLGSTILECIIWSRVEPHWTATLDFFAIFLLSVVASMLVTDVWDELCWSVPLSFYIDVTISTTSKFYHQHLKIVTNVKYLPLTTQIIPKACDHNIVVSPSPVSVVDVAQLNG